MKYLIYVLLLSLFFASCRDVYTEGQTIAKVVKIESILSPPGRSGVQNYFERVSISYDLDSNNYIRSFDPKQSNKYKLNDYVLINLAKNPNKFKVVSVLNVEDIEMK